MYVTTMYVTFCLKRPTFLLILKKAPNFFENSNLIQTFSCSLDISILL